MIYYKGFYYGCGYIGHRFATGGKSHDEYKSRAFGATAAFAVPYLRRGLRIQKPFVLYAFYKAAEFLHSFYPKFTSSTK